MNNSCGLSRIWLFCSVTVFGIVGCGPSYDVAPVTGVVTLDGQPVPNATVVFQPEDGRPSNGTTDSSGKYSLLYTATTEGAEVGPHTVRISTFHTGDSDADPPIPASKETIPAKYNSQSELRAEVSADSAMHDFALDSGGEVLQPVTMSSRGASYAGGSYETDSYANGSYGSGRGY